MYVAGSITDFVPTPANEHAVVRVEGDSIRVLPLAYSTGGGAGDAINGAGTRGHVRVDNNALVAAANVNTATVWYMGSGETRTILGIMFHRAAADTVFAATASASTLTRGTAVQNINITTSGTSATGNITAEIIGGPHGAFLVSSTVAAGDPIVLRMAAVAAGTVAASGGVITVRVTQNGLTRDVPITVARPAVAAVGPTLVSARVDNGAATHLVMVFSEAITGANLDITAGFTVRVNGVLRTVLSVHALAGDTLTMLLAAPVANGQSISVDYVMPGAGVVNRLQAAVGAAPVASFTREAANNVNP
jgi:hypothetical protein